MIPYQKLTPQILESIEEITGKSGMTVSPADLERYSADEAPHANPRLPEVVVTPENAAAVAALLRLASTHNIPITPRGSGTGLSGGCVPLFGGIVLSLEKMNRVLEIDEANQVAVVEPGVTLGQLQQAAADHGLYYPVYPGEKSATLGGNIATNAGGMRAVKYGVTRNFVLGMEAVLAGGQTLTLGGKFVKCTSGYDIGQLMIGSEGTLGIITKATLRLGSLPESRQILFIPFPGLETAIDAVPDILRCGTVPVGLEFMEKDIIEIVEKYTEREMPFHQYAAFLLVMLEGSSREEVLEASRRIEQAVLKHGSIGVFVPPSDKAERDLLEAREKFYPAIKRLGRVELVDTVAPRSLIPKFIRLVKTLAVSHGIEVIGYGHAGDGNVHLHPISRGLDPAEWERKLPGLLRDIYQTALGMGGAISGEHGIGFDKKPYFEALAAPELLAVMKAVKLTFDPGNILNPGKLFSL